MTKRKKKIMLFHLIFWPSVQLLVAIFFILFSIYAVVHFDDGYELRTNISEYSIGSRIHAHCKLLTLHPGEGENGVPLFINEYNWNKATYRYEYIGPDYKENTIQQTSFLALSYDEKEYINASNDVKSQEDFSDKISFQYEQYSFNLNDVYSNDYKYDLERDDPFIKEILLVGNSDMLHSLVFISFYYVQFENYHLLQRTNKSYYNFFDWSTFFNDFYSFYDWSNH